MSADILSAIYDATILLSTGLTTVLGAIFAIATTFLGRSLQDAREAQDQEEQNARADADSAVAEFKKTLAETSHTADSQGTIANLRNQLRAREKAEKARRRKQRLRRFFQGPHLLGVWGSVATPGVFLVVAALGTAAAKAIIGDHFSISLGVWAGSLISLLSGIFLLLLTLKEVERVSRPSTQAFFRSQVDAMKQAMAEREEETRPMLSIECEEDLPIRLTCGEERAIKLAVRNRRNAVHNVNLVLFVPSGSLSRGVGDLVAARDGEGRVRQWV